jgi:hypothetical protein
MTDNPTNNKPSLQLFDVNDPVLYGAVVWSTEEPFAERRARVLKKMAEMKGVLKKMAEMRALDNVDDLMRWLDDN